MTAPREDPDEHRDEATPEPDEELTPAFDVDLDPEDQGTAEAAAESTG